MLLGKRQKCLAGLLQVEERAPAVQMLKQDAQTPLWVLKEGPLETADRDPERRTGGRIRCGGPASFLGWTILRLSRS
jgi:hypothetical protein